MIVEEKFDKFTVYKDTEKHQFCYVTNGRVVYAVISKVRERARGVEAAYT